MNVVLWDFSNAIKTWGSNFIMSGIVFSWTIDISRGGIKFFSNNEYVARCSQIFWRCKSFICSRGEVKNAQETHCRRGDKETALEIVQKRVSIMTIQYFQSCSPQNLMYIGAPWGSYWITNFNSVSLKLGPKFYIFNKLQGDGDNVDLLTTLWIMRG